MSSDDQTGRPADPASRRVSSSSKRAAVARRRAIVGGLAALVIAGGAVLLFTGGDEILPDFVPGVDQGPETPKFAFGVKRVVVETTTATKSSSLAKEAKAAAKDVKATLDELYFDGYVEHDAWGDFGEIEKLFAEDARAQAEADLDTLTLGEAGAEAYVFVEPDEGTLAIQVLADGADRPTQAIATVRFGGTAEGDDGAFTEVRSLGSYFLRADGGGWTIYAYRVDRTERPADGSSPSATSSASASPTAEAEG